MPVSHRQGWSLKVWLSPPSLVGTPLQLTDSNCCWQLQGHFLGLADHPNAQGRCEGSRFHHSAEHRGQPHSALRVSRRALQ